LLASIAAFTAWTMCSAGAAVASASSAPRRLSKQDITDVTARVFPAHRPAFAKVDGWTALSAHEREAWTYANNFLPAPGPFAAARAALLERRPIDVPVRVVVVDADGVAPGPPSVDLERLERVMRAGFEENANGTGVSRGVCREAGSGGVMARFRLERAAPALARRIRDAGQRGAGALRTVLEAVHAESVQWHGANVLFALVAFEDAQLDLPRDLVQVGSARLSWVRCHSTVMLLDVLNVAELAAQRLYVPAPNHFPIPTPQQLRVDVHPYTPDVLHRALWYADFDWTLFEAEVRAMAAPGQVIGFFSTRTTEECGGLCKEALADVERLYRDRGVRAATVLNHHTRPENASWASGAAGSKRPPDEDGVDGAPPEFDIYVVDTARVAAGGGGAKSLEGMAPAVFPGIAVLAMRSSSKGASVKVRQQMVSSIASGVYGVPDAAVHLEQPSSRVLGDVVARLFVSSLLAVHGAEARQLLDDLAEAGIEPAKALGDADYTDMVQRLNLLLYKQHEARAAMSTANDAATAIHYASSARFDVRAMRAKFGLGPRGEPLAGGGFRDLTVRCHFSRIKRGALLLTSRTIEWRGGLFASASYAGSLLATRALLARVWPDKRALKRH
jgi:hypothetical protein